MTLSARGVADRRDAKLVEGVRVAPHARNGVADDRWWRVERLRVAPLDRVNEVLGALRFEAGPVEEQLDGSLDAHLLQHSTQLVANVHRIGSGEDARVDIERGDLRRACEVERI